MKKLMIAAVMAGAFACAADSSYTYTPGDTSLGDGVVTITYDGETADIATLTVNPANGETVTLTGGTATFADNATITLSSSGTVSFASMVTTLGKLSLSRSDGAYIVWKSNTALTEYAAQYQSWTNTFYNGGNIIVGTSLEPNSVVYVSTGNICPGRIERLIDGPTSNIFTFNRVTADHTYTFRPQIAANGIRCVTISRSPRFGYYPTTALWANSRVKGPDKGHWCVANITDGGESLGRVSEWGLKKIMAAKKGMAALANVRFDGGVALGGETSVAAGMEAILAVPEGDNVISEAFTGDGDVRIVPMAPTTAYAGSSYLEPWITTSWQVIATNRSLSALTKLSGKMQGGSHAPGNTEGGSACNAYHLTPNPTDNTVDCQFQLKSSDNNKVVLAKLRQNGANVEIKAVKAGRVAVATYPVGTDLTGITLTSAGLATSTSTSGYGIHMITATFNGESSMGCVTLDGSMNAMIGNQLTFDGGERPLYVKVTSTTAFPSCGNVNVLTNADVKLCAADLTVGLGISDGTSTLKVKRGGILRREDNGQIASSQQVEVDGGTLEHIGSTGIYLNYLLLKDGARMTSGSTAPRSVFNNTRCYYNVVGTEPSSIEGSGIRPYGNSDDSSVRTFQINVNDVTGGDGVDCTLVGIQTPDSRFPYYHFEKYGDGTLKLEGDGKAVRLESRLYGGTFLLGASNSMTNEVVLAGGNLAVADGKSNSLGNLTVNTNATLTVGAGGSLSFASFTVNTNLTLNVDVDAGGSLSFTSFTVNTNLTLNVDVDAGGLLSFASFTAGEGLQPKAITINAPLTGDVLRFGDGTTPLTNAQRACFRWKDDKVATKLWKVKQDANGYLHPNLGFSLSVR